ncbi:MAG TPA: asparagine synthase (glutamine-hydrolyzing) [Nitrospirae bacterium]|nr:asparagine synthase (glutamine-hydrolyzing) [Nitrospirota bacterium]
MCGICGAYNFLTGKPVESELITEMTRTLIHRGPDGEGSYIKDSVGLGHCRLSVIDLSEAGKQPMSNEDGTIWITYNGEIYNYSELRRTLLQKGHVFRSYSDTETIIHLYEEFGVDCLGYLEGMFAFGLWDAKRRRLFLARDRIGIKPLCYYQDRSGIYFASELKAFLRIPFFSKTIDYHALYYYMLSLTVPTSSCIFKDVKKLEPGCFLVVEGGSVKKHKYWEISDIDNSLQSEEQIIGGLKDHLCRVVRSHLISDVPTGALLSGGLDSSSIVALAARNKSDRLETFSVTFKDVPAVDESGYAGMIAQRYNTIHNEYHVRYDFVDSINRIIWHCDEPFAISSAFALFYIFRSATKKVKVILSGDGADELFAGYIRHNKRLLNPLSFVGRGSFKRFLQAYMSLCRGATKHLFLNNETIKWIRRLINIFSPDDACYFDKVCYTSPYYLPAIFNAEFYNENLLTAHEEALSYFSEHYAAWQNSDGLNRRLFTDVKTTLVDEMLAKLDKISMAFGVEARVPFLDHRLVEFALGIPGRLKYGEMGEKQILRKAMEDYLPREILYRKKHGFNVPLGDWFAKDMVSFVNEYLSDSRIKGEGIFNPLFIESIVKRQLSGAGDYSTIIFEVLVWEMWYEKFMDSSI